MIQKGDGKFRNRKQLDQEFDDMYVLVTRRGENIKLGEGYLEYFCDATGNNLDKLWEIAKQDFPNDGYAQHIYRYKGEALPWIV